jgi:pimeloyl-ACP methyl ester carboxylesterase
MAYLEFQGSNIHYQLKENYSEKAIVFIHGSGGNSNVWANQFQIENLKWDYIAIDLPNHNKSDTYPNISLDLYVEVVKAVITAHTYKNILLCGHSLGGAVIQAYYFKYPTKVSGLILCGTGARLRVSPKILDSLKTDYEQFLNSLPYGSFYRKTPKDVIENYLKEARQESADITYKDFNICDKFDTLEKTTEIKVPSLIICGTDDKLTPIKYSKFFDEKIENSQLVQIERAGHMVMIEKPKEVNDAIQKFIKEYQI